MHADSRIHRLTSDDVGLLRQLNAVFAVAFGDTHSYADAPADDDYCRQTLSKEHVIVLVSLAGTTVVGGLVAYELDKLERARREIYIYDLAVAESHCRQGIATQLIERLRAIAQQRSAWVVFVQADRGDGPAIALYEKLGVREEVLHFDLDVA
ncbi:MAG TPA: AAC(3)-I family aminoglycoside N-acetyltransferase [Lysobacter sp.]|jgi:aminoglycoside 3-N-acetyltransferase I|nr:AAC(3)-I family aminoglycoside N-acetyltransferase [Lysobacter sp.]